jgi:cation transport ATPase
MQYKGYIVLTDTLRENCGVLIQKLQQKGVKTILLSGDREANVKATAERSISMNGIAICSRRENGVHP